MCFQNDVLCVLDLCVLVHLPKWYAVFFFNSHYIDTVPCLMVEMKCSDYKSLIVMLDQSIGYFNSYWL